MKKILFPTMVAAMLSVASVAAYAQMGGGTTDGTGTAGGAATGGATVGVDTGGTGAEVGATVGSSSGTVGQSLGQGGQGTNSQVQCNTRRGSRNPGPCDDGLRPLR